MEACYNFLKEYFSPGNMEDEIKMFPLAGDASDRRYYRVSCRIEGVDRTWVLMSWEPFDKNNYPFLSVLSHFAKHGVQVPEVIAFAEKEGLVLLEDLGDLTLERKFWESQESTLSMEFYKKAIDELIKIHFHATADRSDCLAFKVQFDTDKFLWEMNYGRTNLLDGINKFDFSEAVGREITQIFTHICERLHQEEKYLAHRDYHARNLMIKLDEVRVIDFQDARLGPIQYDLVSLLQDSYVDIKDDMAQELIEYYLAVAEGFLPKNFSRDHFNEIYEIQVIQRCFKACGSFSSFYNQRQDTRYLKYIPHALRRVMKGLAGFPEYKVFAQVLIDSGALERRYEAP